MKLYVSYQFSARQLFLSPNSPTSYRCKTLSFILMTEETCPKQIKWDSENSIYVLSSWLRLTALGWLLLLWWELLQWMKEQRGMDFWAWSLSYFPNYSMLFDSRRTHCFLIGWTEVCFLSDCSLIAYSMLLPLKDWFPWKNSE